MSSSRASSAQQTLDSELVVLIYRRPLSLKKRFFKVLYDISQLLNTQLDKETLATCVSLIENGVNPDALAVSVPITLYTQTP
jgi:hypothetical protein